MLAIPSSVEQALMVNRSAPAIPMTARSLLSFFLVGLAVPSIAEAARSGWSQADEAEMRLLLTRTAEGRLEGGVEMLLEPGWYTYWRTPGEAGVPPVFDFSASDNVADVEVRYPAPLRHDDGASVSLIYEDEVVFLLDVTPTDAGRPVTLRANVIFGVCSDICVPTSADAEVTLPPEGDSDPLSTARLRAFASRGPGPPEPGAFDIETVAETDDALEIDVRTPDSSYFDLFAAPPEGWFIGQPRLIERSGDIVRWRLDLAGKPHNSQVSGQQFTFVAVAGGAAIAKTVRIP
jgi:DsbC/DsbD-like thiol-disulfide interchange protein